MVVFFVLWAMVAFVFAMKNSNKPYHSDDSITGELSFVIALVLTFVFAYFVSSNATYRKDKIVRDKDQIIYSLKTGGGLEGSFFLGSGSVTQPYTAFQEVDGGFQKISIDSSAILKEDSNLSNQGYVESYSCEPGERASYLFLSTVDKDWCDISVNKDIVLHVPKNTVMLDFKVD